jgi:hypothetical protein
MAWRSCGRDDRGGPAGGDDEIIATAVKRQHEPQRVVGDLLGAEINEKKARSIKYQMTIAKLPLAKDIDDFDAAEINETLCATSLPAFGGETVPQTVASSASPSNSSAMSC